MLVRQLLRGIAARFVPGETTDDAVLATEKLVTNGLAVTIGHLGDGSTDAYVELLGRLADLGLTGHAEVSIKPSTLADARRICRAARDAGSSVTLELAEHTSTDSTLDLLARLRQDFPATGVALQARLRRTEADCRELAYAGSRVRLCQRGYAEPGSVAYRSDRDVGTSYVRCLKVLMKGDGYPMVATHDPRLIAIASVLAERAGRGRDDFEYQLPYGVRPGEQLRLAGAGNTVRVYVPYGADWYGYLSRLPPGPLLRSLRTQA